MAHWKFALFSEDTVQTSSTLSSASKSEKDSMDISCFSPPEFHSSCILENSPTRLRIWTVGGHYAENPIFNCRANKVKTSLDAIVFSLKLKFFKTFLKICLTDFSSSSNFGLVWFDLVVYQVSTFYYIWTLSKSFVWWWVVGNESNFSVHLWSKP